MLRSRSWHTVCGSVCSYAETLHRAKEKAAPAVHCHKSQCSETANTELSRPGVFQAEGRKEYLVLVFHLLFKSSVLLLFKNTQNPDNITA